jgi:hypothetical protein
MKPMIFVFTRYIGEHGKVRANLANTKLKKGSYELPYCHSHSVADNHLIAARSWVVFNMPGVDNQPIGIQSYDNGYLFAFAV